MSLSRFKPHLFLSLLLLSCPGAVAFQQAQVRIPTLQAQGWSLQDMAVQFAFHPRGHLSGSIRIRSLELAAARETLERIEVSCPRLELERAEVRCRGGRFRVADWRGRPLAGRLELTYHRAEQDLELTLEQVTLAEGRLQAGLKYADAGWTLDFRGEGMSLEALAALTELDDSAGYLPSAGRLTVAGSAAGSAGLIERVRFDLALTGAAFSNRSGLVAGEGLAAEVTLDGRRRADGISGGFDLRLDGGGLYVDPVYEEFSNRKVAISGRYDYRAGAQRLDLDEVRLAQTGVVEAGLEAVLYLGQTPRLESARLDLRRLELAGFVPPYVSPWLAATAFPGLTAQGRLSGELQVADGRLDRFRLLLDNVSVADAGERLRLNRIAGNLAWGRDARPREMRLSWQGGSLYRFDLGPASFRLRSEGGHYRLLEPAEITLLDGVLMLDEWELSHPGSDAMQWRIDAILTPVSMQRVTEALQWPSMQGRLSGVIPDVQYAQGRLEVGGMLLVRAFDGAIRLRNLRLEQPLGLVPQLYTDIDFEDIDLEQLTGTFSFGRIEGRLDGHVRDLWLQNWEPVAFDARLATPEGDASRHRISQKAVDNLSRIGGGVGQALSQTFLGFFETFPYDRLGISCRLRNGVCDMGGVAPAEQGYYLVKGTWLPPRINVIGYAEQVDWDALVARIQAATAGGSPEVQ